MALETQTYLYTLVASISLYCLISYLLRRLDNAFKARRLGTQTAPVFPQPVWDVFGLQALRRVQRADEERKVPMLGQERYKELKQIYGRPVHTFSLTVAGASFFMTRDPINIQAMLAKQFNDFALGTRRRGNFFPLLGNGIFTSDGKAWEHSRALLRPSFSRDQVSDLSLDERHVVNLMKALPAAPDGWTQQVDMQILFFRLTIDSSTEFLFGESVNSQINDLAKETNQRAQIDDQARNEDFAHAFDVAQLYLAKRARLGAHYWLLNNAEFRRTCRQCHDFIDYYVHIALNTNLKKHESREGNDQEKGRYIFLEELARQTQDPIEMRSQLLHILLAGRDTTASLLGWTFYLLARHPEEYQKLRKTIIETFGEYDVDHLSISFSALKGCQSLQAVLNESLRLFPPVPLNGRMATKDTTLPRGGGADGLSPIFIPKGTNIGYSVYSMHRAPEFWGEDCDEFRPLRWSARRPGWEFLPFNGGPRICLGQQFALTSAGYAIVRLLQRFDGIENLDHQQMRQNATLTSCSDTGVKIRLHEAGSS